MADNNNPRWEDYQEMFKIYGKEQKPELKNPDKFTKTYNFVKDRWDTFTDLPVMTEKRDRALNKYERQGKEGLADLNRWIFEIARLSPLQWGGELATITGALDDPSLENGSYVDDWLSYKAAKRRGNPVEGPWTKLEKAVLKKEAENRAKWEAEEAERNTRRNGLGGDKWK